MITHRSAALCVAAVLSAGAVAPALARAETHVVTIEGMAFTPSTLTIKRGDSVVWRNKDLVPHTATMSAATSAKARFDSGSIAPGKSWTHVMRVTGQFDYVCTYHPGMKASLVVQ